MKVDPPVERKDIERCHRLGRVDAQKNHPKDFDSTFRFGESTGFRLPSQGGPERL